MPPLICTAHQGPGKSPDPSELFALTQHYTRARRLPYESDYGTSIAYCQTRVSLICTRMRGILNDGDDVVGWVVQAPPFLFLFTLTLTLSHRGRGDKRLPFYPLPSRERGFATLLSPSGYPPTRV